MHYFIVFDEFPDGNFYKIIEVDQYQKIWPDFYQQFLQATHCYWPFYLAVDTATEATGIVFLLSSSNYYDTINGYLYERQLQWIVSFWSHLRRLFFLHFHLICVNCKSLPVDLYMWRDDKKQEKTKFKTKKKTLISQNIIKYICSFQKVY